MTEEVRQDTQVQEAIKHLFVGSIPERKSELSTIWENLSPIFQMLPDVHPEGRFIMDAGLYRYIRFNHRVVRSFWIAAFAAWECYRTVAESQDVCNFDLEKIKALILAFDNTIKNDQSDEEPLPPGIPEPGVLPDKDTDPQGRATAELAIIALSWALLHEVRHIQHQQQNTSATDADSPECWRREELSCDAFATKFLLEQMQSYSIQTGYDSALVRRKREMAIYFALFALTLLAKNSWEESDTHPSVQDRINAVCTLMGNDRDELAEAIAHTAFSVLRTFWPLAPTITILTPSNVQ
jgi:Peptidase U49.